MNGQTILVLALAVGLIYILCNMEKVSVKEKPIMSSQQLHHPLFDQQIMRDEQS